MPGTVFIGTSGFVYRDWRRGVFYPVALPQREELEYYARHFRTVELNNPFYRLPSREQFRTWRTRAPADFVFAVKASRFITHVRRLHDASEPVGTFLEHAGALGAKLGPVLFQLPPTLPRDMDRLRALLGALPAGGRFVLEVRHPSWLDEDVYATLRDRGAALCLAIGGTLDVAGPPEPSPFVFIRMHSGRGRGGNFTPGQLDEWAGRIAALRDAGRDVYVYFNNDREGFAVRNALALRALLGMVR